VITFVLLLPVMVAFAELIVIGGRVAVTKADVQSAAREAARQASIASGPGTADNVINDAVAVALADKGFRCQSPSVNLGSSTLFIRGGRVEVVVTCTVQLSDIALLTAPGTVTVTGSAIEPIDQYRVIN
jgi:Flp pilus assembly protein TadG